jgi:phenylacetate-CoA ligase
MYENEQQFMKADKIMELQESRLKKLVKHCYENVPLYKKRFKEANITPQDIKSVSDLHKIPFTVKNDLREHYPYGIHAVPMNEVVRLHASSGTTGKPTVVTYNRKDLNDWIKLMARCLSCTGVAGKDIVQNCYGYGLFTGGLGFHYGAEELGATVIPVSTGNTKRQVMLLKDMQSTVLFCTPSYAINLAEAAKHEGFNPKEDFNVRIGVFGAEPWSEGMRKQIEADYGLQAFDMYGMSELYGPGVAVECEKQNGLHIWSTQHS